jgi:mRNA interferase MazF
MRFGKMLRAGDIIIASIQFTDFAEVKTRPAVVLFEELGNVVIAGITSNQKMKGIPLTKNEGAIKDSVIKLNYIFTISQEMVSRVIFHLSYEKKALIFEKLIEKFGDLKTRRAIKRDYHYKVS